MILRRSFALLALVVVLVVAQLPFTMRTAEAFAPAAAPVLIPAATPILAPVAGAAAAVVVGGAALWGLWTGGKWAFGKLKDWASKTDCEANGGEWLESQEADSRGDWVDLGGGNEARCIERDTAAFYTMISSGQTYTWSSSDGQSGATNEPAKMIRDFSITANVQVTGTYNHVRIESHCFNPDTGQALYKDGGGTPTSPNQQVTVTRDCMTESGSGPESRITWVRVRTCGINCGTVHAESEFKAVGTGTSTEADRQLRTRVTCRDGNGGSYTVEELGPLYAGGDEPPILPAASCLDRDRMTGLEVDQVDGGTGAAVPTTRITDWTLPESYLDPAYQYKDCMVTQCKVEVWIKYPDGTYARCSDQGDLCEGWASSPSRDDIYECWFGPYPVPLNQCLALRDTHDPATAGKVITVPAPEPLMPPVISPHPNPNPTTEPNPNPDPEQQPGTNPEADSGFWTKLFTKLFVPQHAPEAAEALGNTISGRTPFAQIGSGVEWLQTLGDPGEACWKVAVTVEGGEYGPLDCQGQLYDWLRANRAIFAVAIYGMLVIPLLWWAWRTYAPGSTGTA